MKLMKLLALTIAVLLLAGGCGTGAAVGKGADRNVVGELTQKALDEHQMIVEVKFINPVGASAFPSFDGYRMKISGGKVKAYLPYFGRSYTPIIAGVDESGIVFDDCEIEIREDYSKSSKGKYFWKFSAESGNEKVDVVISFMNDGSAQISCNSVNRSPITYRGELIPEESEQ